MTKFSISAEDYNEILRLGKIFTATSSRENLKNVHIKTVYGDERVELYAEASDGYIYGAFRLQFVSYEGDLADFTIPATMLRADKGTIVEFIINDDFRDVYLTSDGRRINIPNVLEYAQYPNFDRVLPAGVYDGDIKAFFAGKVASCLKWFRSSESVATWISSPDCIYFSTRNRAACAMGTKKKAMLENVLLDFTHRRA